LQGTEEGGLSVGQQEEEVLLEGSDWYGAIETLWVESEVHKRYYDILQICFLQFRYLEGFAQEEVDPSRQS
jgi:hypothetical protein